MPIPRDFDAGPVEEFFQRWFLENRIHLLNQRWKPEQITWELGRSFDQLYQEAFHRVTILKGMWGSYQMVELFCREIDQQSWQPSRLTIRPTRNSVRALEFILDDAPQIIIGKR